MGVDKAIPEVVLRSMQFHLTKLCDVESALSGVERARGHGHTLALEFRDRIPVMISAFGRLTEIHALSQQNDVEEQFLSVVRAQGPRNLQHFGAMGEIAPPWWPKEDEDMCDSAGSNARPRG